MPPVSSVPTAADEVIISNTKGLGDQSNLGANLPCAILYGIFYCVAARKSSDASTPPFRDIDFTAADILARVLARALPALLLVNARPSPLRRSSPAKSGQTSEVSDSCAEPFSHV